MTDARGNAFSLDMFDGPVALVEDKHAPSALPVLLFSPCDPDVAFMGVPRLEPLSP